MNFTIFYEIWLQLVTISTRKKKNDIRNDAFSIILLIM